MSPRGIVFDLDGVLVDSEHLWEQSWVAESRRHGTTWTEADTARLQGMSVPEWSHALADRLGLGHDHDVRLADSCVSFVVDRVVAHDEAALLEGALPLLSTARAVAPVALASSAARRVIDAVLAHHGIADCFVATVSSEEVARGKPFPDVYREAARRLGVAATDCVAFEDSTNGIRAASAAGATVVALPNPHYPPSSDALGLARYVAASHAEAEHLLCHELVLEETR